MKKKICLILFLFNSLSLYAQENAKRSILKVLEDQRQAWNKGDMEGYMQGYIKSDSLVFVGRKGPEYGWNTTLENYRKAYPDKATMGMLTFDIKKVTFLNKGHAFVLGGWHLKREKDAPQGYFTLIMKKVDGKWKVISDHSS